MVYLGCNWKGVFDTQEEAQAAEREHWAKMHEEEPDARPA
jgi:hypothetical protein